jgi:hypothetical protein
MKTEAVSETQCYWWTPDDGRSKETLFYTTFLDFSLTRLPGKCLKATRSILSIVPRDKLVSRSHYLVCHSGWGI